ncbi:hypothetical protein QEH68_06740 [Paenarthrobacter sp. OM7]|uniref:hypothetical protein n=1 Tax=Paenarthrobacter sp. OM7 TaxID=3041264 RepID=UPI0024685E7F|nr:hypothetical protein [Paenarthrobacter sp. OM7]WGM21865.1 hypothetical protein QEH68_06740 [Paenarthrobacter sp. OM7]
MTEALNLDDWLDGAKRTERSVTLYARNDLLADIDELEAKLRQIAEVPFEDRSMGDSAPGKDLQDKIDDLYVELDQSKMVFRVSFLDDEELEEITEQVKKDIKEDIDKAASAARAEAREKCKRLEISAVNDINSMVRTMANTAADEVIRKEADLRTITKAVVSPQLTLTQARKLAKTVGEAQMGLLKQAYSRAAVEAPKVAVPKSSKPSPTDDGVMSS